MFLILLCTTFCSFFVSGTFQYVYLVFQARTVYSLHLLRTQACILPVECVGTLFACFWSTLQRILTNVTCQFIVIQGSFQTSKSIGKIWVFKCCISSLATLIGIVNNCRWILLQQNNFKRYCLSSDHCSPVFSFHELQNCLRVEDPFFHTFLLSVANNH